MSHSENHDEYIDTVNDNDFYGTSAVWVIIGVAGLGAFVYALKVFTLLF